VSVADRVDKDGLVKQLGATIGDAKAAESVEAAAATLGLLGATYSAEEAVALLDVLAEQPGIVGIAAKLMRVRQVLKAKR